VNLGDEETTGICALGRNFELSRTLAG
jgi:hypothetical protein